jgi:VanZ family protein
MIKKALGTVWPALSWSVIIFILLIIPGRDLPPGPEVPQLDKIIHIFLFGAQVWLWSTYFRRKGKFKALPGIFFLIFLLSCLYGIGMEYYQKYFVPHRDFELGDILADITGSGLAWLIISLVKGDEQV